MKAAIPLLLLVAGCDRAPVATAVPDDSPGGRLEAAALDRGLIADPAKVGLAGSWGSETDRLCVVPAGGALRLGASVDYGPDQACAAAGTVVRTGDTLDVRFEACRFEARFEGDRIVFPAVLPQACERFCTGRASLASLTVERLSQSVSEAAVMRTASGTLLCGPG